MGKSKKLEEIGGKEARVAVVAIGRRASP